MEDNKMTDQTVTNIDKALAAARARKAAKASTGDQATKAASPGDGTEAKKRARISDEERAAKQKQLEEARAARKAEKQAAREAKLAERMANRQPAHMKKVARAAEKLGALSQAALLLFNEATHNLSASDLATLALHIQHFNRVKATERALSQALAINQKVRIVSGDPRFVGKVGTVSKVQRIRCYVDVPGSAKPAYLFTSDVERVEEQALEEPNSATG